MTDEDKKLVHKFFAEKAKKYGDSSKTLDMSEDGQMVRFKVISEVKDLNNSSILDVGCGLGHLYEFLKKKNISTKYTGVDVVPELIDLAKKKNPDLTLEIRDILTDKFEENSFDVVIENGIFNVTLEKEDTLEFTKRMIAEMFKIAKKTVVLTFTSEYVDEGYNNPEITYFSPTELFKYCKTLCRNVTLRHDYLPHDFTIIMQKSS